MLWHQHGMSIADMIMPWSVLCTPCARMPEKIQFLCRNQKLMLLRNLTTVTLKKMTFINHRKALFVKGTSLRTKGGRTHNQSGFRGHRNDRLRWWIRFEWLNLNFCHVFFCFELFLGLVLGLIKKIIVILHVRIYKGFIAGFLSWFVVLFHGGSNPGPWKTRGLCRCKFHVPHDWDCAAKCLLNQLLAWMLAYRIFCVVIPCMLINSIW